MLIYLLDGEVVSSIRVPTLFYVDSSRVGKLTCCTVLSLSGWREKVGKLSSYPPIVQYCLYAQPEASMDVRMRTTFVFEPEI